MTNTQHQNTNQHDDDEKPKQVVYYSVNDLQQFENTNRLSSIGKMTLSCNLTAPCFGFGTSTRKQQANVFQSKETSKAQFFGKTSPGPNYEVRHTDKYYYKDDPRWSFAKSVRNTLDVHAKHAYYLRDDIDFDPITADGTRRWKSGVAKIGLESRFADTGRKNKVSPGPDYNPSLKPEIPSSPKFSLGIRRDTKGNSPLILMASTPKEVGPGSYLPLKYVQTSSMPTSPNVGFTKDEKLRLVHNNIQVNQTYDTRSCMGEQICSKNTSMAKVSIGKSTRDVRPGMFKDMMATQPAKIRIQHRF